MSALDNPQSTDDDVHDAEPPLVATSGTTAPPTSTRAQIRKEQRQLLLRSPAFLAGCLIVSFWILAALVPDLLSRWEPKATVVTDAGERLRSSPPDGTAWFGTDRLGRDVYSRVIHGTRPILIAAPLATAIASITFGPTQPVVIGAIAFLFIAPVARTIRAATLAESQLDYVEAARMRGESSLFILGREILPNVATVVTVEITVRLGYAIFTLATLAFLGLSGGNATDPNWGVDVAGNFGQIVADVWWPTIFPALAIGSLVIGVNLIADSIDRVNKS